MRFCRGEAPFSPGREAEAQVDKASDNNEVKYYELMNMLIKGLLKRNSRHSLGALEPDYLPPLYIDFSALPAPAYTAARLTLPCIGDQLALLTFVYDKLCHFLDLLNLLLCTMGMHYALSRVSVKKQKWNK